MDDLPLHHMNTLRAGIPHQCDAPSVYKREAFSYTSMLSSMLRLIHTFSLGTSSWQCSHRKGYFLQLLWCSYTKKGQAEKKYISLAHSKKRIMIEDSLASYYELLFSHNIHIVPFETGTLHCDACPSCRDWSFRHSQGMAWVYNGTAVHVPRISLEDNGNINGYMQWLPKS